MPRTGLKVCGGMVVVWCGVVCKPILVFSLSQAEQLVVYLVVGAWWGNRVILDGFLFVLFRLFEAV